VIPVLTAFDRLHTDTAYGANAAPAVSQRATHVDDVVLSQGGFIMKMSASSVDTPVRRDVTYYTIKPGDTVQSVAGRYGLTLDTLRWANNIADVTSVVQGQRLVVPPVNGILVKVQPNTLLSGLAIQYHVKVQDIIDFNLIRDPDHLKPGTMLMLPDGVGPSLADPGVGKKTIRSVSANRSRTTPSPTATHRLPAPGVSSHTVIAPGGWRTSATFPGPATPGSGGTTRSSSATPRAKCRWWARSWSRASAGRRPLDTSRTSNQ